MEPNAHLAEAVFAEAQPALLAKPPSPRPTLVVLAGVPLSGKSTLARALAAAAATRTLHVENDALRRRLAPAPLHDARENFLTYRAAWTLAGLALRGRANALLDATNLTDSGRKPAYAAADAARAGVAVLFVRTPPEVLASRAALQSAERRAAFAKLGAQEPTPEASRPFVVVDGGAGVEENLARLRAWAPLAALSLGGAASGPRPT